MVVLQIILLVVMVVGLMDLLTEEGSSRQITLLLLGIPLDGLHRPLSAIW